MAKLADSISIFKKVGKSPDFSIGFLACSQKCEGFLNFLNFHMFIAKYG